MFETCASQVSERKGASVVLRIVKQGYYSKDISAGNRANFVDQGYCATKHGDCAFVVRCRRG